MYSYENFKTIQAIALTQNKKKQFFKSHMNERNIYFVG